MTLARAVADERREIVCEIDRRVADLRNRTIFGFVALEQFKLWLLARAEKEREESE